MIYDISRPITEDMAVYKNKAIKKPRFTWIGRYAEDHYNESNMCMNLHSGTHFDAPLHMIDGGGSIRTLDLENFLGPCRLIDLSHLERKIEAKDLEPFNIQKGERLVIRTRNSYEEDFNPDFICLLPSAAELLRDIGIRALAIDAMSIERGDPEHPVHRIILGAGIGVLEDVRLAGIPEGNYEIIALPLYLAEREGAPARAVLRTVD